MKNFDDELSGFKDVATRIQTEFSELDVEAPALRASKSKRPFAIAISAVAVATSLVVAPSFTGESEINKPAWAAVPTKLTDSQLQEIKFVCTELGEPAPYEIAIADERMERGFMILKADRGPEYKPALKRFATIMCQYERTEEGFAAPSIYLSETPSLGNSSAWGEEEIGKQKVWVYLSAIEPNVKRVVITTAEGLEFDASVANGFTASWWPRVESEKSGSIVDTNAFARFYDQDGKLIKTFSLLTGETTTP